MPRFVDPLKRRPAGQFITIEKNPSQSRIIIIMLPEAAATTTNQGPGGDAKNLECAPIDSSAS
jgi:hypothetical protein